MKDYKVSWKISITSNQNELGKMHNIAHRAVIEAKQWVSKTYASEEESKKEILFYAMDKHIQGINIYIPASEFSSVLASVLDDAILRNFIYANVSIDRYIDLCSVQQVDESIQI